MAIRKAKFKEIPYNHALLNATYTECLYDTYISQKYIFNKSNRSNFSEHVEEYFSSFTEEERKKNFENFEQKLGIKHKETVLPW